MTATGLSALRVVSFGDLEGGIWGAAIAMGETAMVFATPEGTGSVSGVDGVRLTDDKSSWRLQGEAFELLIIPEPDRAGDGGQGERDPSEADHVLCRIQGTLAVAGVEHSVRCVGIRSTSDGLDPAGLESLRGVSAWFYTDRGLALLAFRPVEGAGQERDLVTATVFEPEGTIAVADARLSTTYRSGDKPSRASLELWVGEGDEQYPRRAAAEALGDGLGVDGDRLMLQVTPLLCHTGGLDGAGVYVLARF